MKRRITVLITLILTVTYAFAQTTPQEMMDRMGVGINLGNIMSAPTEGQWAKPIEEFYFDDIVKQGFGHVRIPVRWDLHTSENAPYTIDQSWLNRVEQVVNWALERDLVVVLNAHGEHWFLDESEKTMTDYPNQQKMDRFLAIWTQVVDHFKEAPEELLFEVINEPYFRMSKTAVDKLNRDVLSIIREENPTRCVLVTGGGKNSYEAPMQMEADIFEEDDFLIAWFHYYWPNTFTKYPETKNSKPTWGTEEEINDIRTNFTAVKDWADDMGAPLYLGEFGVNIDCEPKSRSFYHQKVVEICKDLGIVPTVWCAGPKANKLVYFREKGQWDETVLDGLFPKRKEKKNVLFIIVDDLNTDLFAYGNQQVVSPNFDVLSEQGIRFTNTYCSYPVCGPSRASLMTGTYPEHNGVTNLSLQLRDTSPNITTLPQHLKANGYNTNAVGKIFDPRNVDNGHDTGSWTSEYSISYDYPEKYGDFTFSTQYRVETSKMATERGPEGVDDDGYIDGQIALDACNKLESFSQEDKPFFLAVGFKKPHLPFVAPDKYWALYDNVDLTLAPYQQLPEGTDVQAFHTSNELFNYGGIPAYETWTSTVNGFENVMPTDTQEELVKGYYAAVSYIDAQIGKVLDKLEESGQKDNTIIIVTSDHGFKLGDHNIWGKHNLLRNAVQVPLWIIDPSNPKAGKEENRAAQLIDLYPTICDMLQLPKPEQLQGNSLLVSDNAKSSYPVGLAVSHFRKSGKMGYAFAKGDYNYTLWTANSSTTPMNIKYSEASSYMEELYINEGGQSDELVNLINAPEHASALADIKKDVAQWWDAYYNTVHNIEPSPISDNLITINPEFEEAIENGWGIGMKSDGSVEASISSITHKSNNSKACEVDMVKGGIHLSHLTLKSDIYNFDSPTTEEIKVKLSSEIYADKNITVRYLLSLNDNDIRLTGNNLVVTATSEVKADEIIIPAGVSKWQFFIQLGGNDTGKVVIDNASVHIIWEEEEEETDELALAAQKLSILFKEGDNADAVTQNIGLPIQGEHNTDIQWSVSNKSIVDISGTEGVISRPTDQGISVLLKAVISKEGKTREQFFFIWVKAENDNDEPPLSIDNIVDNQFYLYPNPAYNLLNIQGLSGKRQLISIYNLMGKVVITHEVEKQQAKLNIESIPSGLYFIRVGYQSYRFIKQ